ncbi:hypothetical protein [Bacillus sp. SG-1]|uniref:hypothetical protein n=1 Tax=Bacillus sp. SG-1 TaxID=161544 RepID=UPI0001543372|nr:hypothetical protein [Bacillus sp. SG-1]EDL66493.1 hypothetical protein BSG1_04035 [Bacillus sp. SG-1]
MTSFAALLFWYPAAFLLMGVVLGILFKTTKVNVLIVLILGFFFSNLAFFYLTEGGLPGIERNAEGKGFAVFSDLSFSETLSVLLTPTFYTLFYIFLLIVGFLVVNALKKGRGKSISM